MTKDESLKSSDVQIGISEVLPPVQEKHPLNRWKLIRTRACLSLVLIAIGLIAAGKIRGKKKIRKGRNDVFSRRLLAIWTFLWTIHQA